MISFMSLQADSSKVDQKWHRTLLEQLCRPVHGSSAGQPAGGAGQAGAHLSAAVSSAMSSIDKSFRAIRDRLLSLLAAVLLCRAEVFTTNLISPPVLCWSENLTGEEGAHSHRCSLLIDRLSRLCRPTGILAGGSQVLESLYQ